MAERPEILHLDLHGDTVAVLRERRRNAGIELRYTQLALDRWDALEPVISCSLPVSGRPQEARFFLNGLLPEGPARTILAAQRDLLASDTWGLLAAYGRDIAGALVIADPVAGHVQRVPDAIDYDSVGAIADAVAALPDRPLGVHDDSELSLAGVQDKLLLVEADSASGWGRPIGGLPSTHILKPDPFAHPGVIEREAEALAIARAVGLTTIDPRLINVNGRTCLIVNRYDRVTDGDRVRRVHQEDLLQAVGLDPADHHGRIKYQEHGGPGFRELASLLTERAEDPDNQLRTLVGAMVFTVLIGNSDAHAKNWSLLLEPAGTVRLAPLYDTVPTMLFDRLKVRCAMWIGGVHRSLQDVTFHDLVREVAGRHAWKVSESHATAWVDSWLRNIAEVADDTPTGAYVTRRAHALLRQR